MSVLLEGLQFPHGNPITINIYRDGSWCDAYTTEDGKAIEVHTPHGDLIDRDTIDYYEVERNGEKHYMVWKPHIDGMPTIIEAEDKS